MLAELASALRSRADPRSRGGCADVVALEIGKQSGSVAIMVPPVRRYFSARDSVAATKRQRRHYQRPPRSTVHFSTDTYESNGRYTE